jgi:hypothetical protein
MNLKQMIQHVYWLKSFTLNSEYNCKFTVQRKISVTEHYSNCGLLLSASPMDGNCFFHSVATNILHARAIRKGVLKDVGLLHSTDETIPENLPQRLRKAFVSEITGERQRYYRDFINKTVD